MRCSSHQNDINHIFFFLHRQVTMAGYKTSTIVAAKRAERDKALQSATPYLKQTHGEYLSATGPYNRLYMPMVFKG
jgi:hypothetical protein